MTFVAITIAIFILLFFASIYVIRVLGKARLTVSLKQTMKEGATQEAIRTLLKIIRKNPADGRSRMELVKLYMEEKAYGEAIGHLCVAGRQLVGQEAERVGAFQLCPQQQAEPLAQALVKLLQVVAAVDQALDVAEYIGDPLFDEDIEQLEEEIFLDQLSADPPDVVGFSCQWDQILCYHNWRWECCCGTNS